MRRNKMGAMFLVSVLALAGVGVSYAGFTDAISVYGEVDTATVTLELEYFSCTYVWKIWDWQVGEPADDDYMDYDVDGEIAIYHGPCADVGDLEYKYFTNMGTPVCTYELISWAKARRGGDTYDVEIDFHNIFPCIDFMADFIVHYTGSIPAKLKGPHYLDQYTATNGPLYVNQPVDWMEYLWLLKHPSGDGTIDPAQPYGIWFEAYEIDPDWNDPVKKDYIIDYDILNPVDIGYQVHYCDYILFIMYIHLPQDNIFQGCSGTFNLEIGAIQWNDLCVVTV